MEIWDIYDSNRIKTGRTHPRGEKLGDGEYMLVAMILIFDTQGRMLIQQRPKHLGWEPGKWTMTAGGAVKAGETAARAAARELYEELGITLDFFGKCASFSRNLGSAFLDYFVFIKDIDLSPLPVPNDEVDAVKWVTKDEMLEKIKRGECINYRPAFVEFCFDLIMDTTF